MLNTLPDDVAWAFGADGPLARHHPNYTPREGQVRMALAVADAVQDRGCLVVEAGTGIGKTYAYLVPALLSGRKVVVCTATKTLQDQLFGRDLPQVAQRLGVAVQAALLKGRGSYLCRERMAQARNHLLDHDRHALEALRRVERWAAQTPDGDLTDAAVLVEGSPLWPLLTSTRDNCLGAGCPQFDTCHVYAARRKAASADVVVANHHLFFADRMVREVADTGLLPTPDLLVFDEAHHLADTAAQFMAEVFAASVCREWGRDCLRWWVAHAAGAHGATGLAVALEMALAQLQGCLPIPPQGTNPGAEPRLAWSDMGPMGVDPDRWELALQTLADAMGACLDGLERASDGGATVRALGARGRVLQQRLAFFAVKAGGLGEGGGAVEHARWVVCSRPFRLVRAPLVVSGVFAAPGADADGAVGAVAHPPGPALVFTSATLALGGDWSWFTDTLGLGAHRVLQIDSPFNHQRQCALHVPLDLPLPADPAHPRALAEKVWPWVQRLRGRTLVLATTTRAVQQLAEVFRGLQRSALDPVVLAQGAGSKADMLSRFRSAAQADGAVLVATASFWEGVDLPGDVLQLLVIDKLPFTPPDDPWVQARWQADTAAGRSPFKSSVLPAAAVALRQGVGRLIRSETDHGLVVIGDRRLVAKPYGAYLRRALPPMAVLADEVAVLAWVDSLVTTTSTRDLPWI